MKRILVGLDGSSRAKGVLTSATRIARAQGAKLILLRSVGLPPDVPQDFWKTTDASLLEVLQSQARAYLDEQAKLVPTELLEKGEGIDENAWEERADTPRQEDLLTLVYTSGTTGVPKGVMLTHGNALGEVDAIDTALELRENDVVLSFLPLAHIFARAIHWCALKGGYTTVYTSIAKAADDMKEVMPTCVPSVPRFFEKMRTLSHAKTVACQATSRHSTANLFN